MAIEADHRGPWVCVFTSQYRMFSMSYWGDYASSRHGAYANALAKCHHEAEVPQNCHLYTCLTEEGFGQGQVSSDPVSVD